MIIRAFWLLAVKQCLCNSSPVFLDGPSLITQLVKSLPVPGSSPGESREFSQKVRERTTWGGQSFQELIRFFIFLVCFYTQRWNTKVMRGQQSFYQNQVLHTNVYKGLRGVTSSSGQGACWQFMTLSLWQWSVNKDTYFSRGDYSQNRRHPNKVTSL